MPCALCASPTITLAEHIVVYPAEQHTELKLLDLSPGLNAPFGRQDYGGLLFPTHFFCENHNRVDAELTPPQLADTVIVDIAGTSPSPAEVARARPLLTLINEIRGQWLVDLLDHGGLYSVAQPIVDRAGNRFAHEMLMRGMDAHGNAVMPDRMLEAAATTALRARLDQAARLAAVTNSARIPDKGCIFINFLPSSVYDPDFSLDETLAAIRTLDIDPARIVFEVVETDEITDFELLDAIFGRFRREGFAIALDDFGTGFNNIETVIRLRPEYIKLDKMLVMGAVDDTMKSQFVLETVSIAQLNGIKTIAEGVENQRTLDHIRKLGCDYFQGYHLGRPKPVGTTSA
ncbi:EAL domain-containing protein [Hwanghaeella grinnelliae]|uniref:EAL domain-containing protein n=1 Tax=Hwanghaeella grinnelliae TaxID=2500179 RepID=A0A437QP69_9PROT|nr:EAL domain-containing protein [Hwanghaeella grinnelliae]RVU36331.1 EAL domain-containing protein [Hwanghaeella grinnelliae]